jgi:molybdopterin-guanine dinucleotide biosynthesis protein MobB
MPDALPIFGICGHSGSGKTTLIEVLLPRLLSRRISVAVAKVHAHGIEVDRPGKDSDRFFRSGADVFLEDPDQRFIRTHPPESHRPIRPLAQLARDYDLVLVEGRKRVECAKVWLLGEGESKPPPEAGEVIAALPRDHNRLEVVWNILETWLPRRWLETAVYGCILIGGRSTRMGRPKHLLREGEKTWLEHIAESLARVSERLVIAGAGEIPDQRTDAIRLPDAPDASGPLAGVLSAMRWAPNVSWLVSACDLPKVSVEAFRWLLSTRAPGVWATLPRLGGERGVEPLLAHYDFRARRLLEELAADGRFSPSLLAGHPKIISPTPGAEILPAWKNVNTPEELARSEPQGQ